MLVRVPIDPEANDEQLLLALASGDHSALAPLYQRYVPLVFRMASQALGPAAAEDIVQEVFASVWQNAETFDPRRGPVRPWILQIARGRVLNELRRRSRKPESSNQTDVQHLPEIADGPSHPEQSLWEEYRRSAVRNAICNLPPPQRQALSLAFIEDLTHEQVADALKLPLGTAKTRIRSGIQRLRIALAAIAAVFAAVLAIGFGIRYRSERLRHTRTEAALRMVTTSDVQVVKLVAAPGAPPDAHGHYRTRPGGRIAVTTFSHLPPPTHGKVYQAWARHGGDWLSLGLGTPDESGRGLIVYEDHAPLAQPQALQVTLEPEGGSASPTGPPLISWP